VGRGIIRAEPAGTTSDAPVTDAGSAEVAHAPATPDQRFLAAIVESADDAIFAKALDGTILSWNTGARLMYGYAPEEIVGQLVFRLAPPDRHPEIADILQRIARGQRIDHFETERVRRNGELFPVSVAISPVRDASGVIIGASTVARDITAQRRLVEAVEFQQSLLRAGSEASLDGILVVDPGGRIAFVNSQFAEVWGLPVLPAIGGGWEAVVSLLASRARDVGEFRDRFLRLAEQTEGSDRGQIALRDGRVLDSYTAPVSSEQGRHFGRAWFFRDVTAETIHAEQLRAIIASIDEAAFVCDPDGLILLRNPAAQALLPRATNRQDIDAALRPASDEPEPLDGSTGASSPDEYVMTVGGKTRWVKLVSHVVPIPTPDPRKGDEVRLSRGTIILLRDLTELRDVQASREAFVGVLSHELRTPITTIYGAAKLLQRSRTAATRRELMRDVEAESDRLYRLVEDLLVLTRIERESLQVADEPVLIGPIARRVVAAELARSLFARIELEVPDRLPMARGEDTYVEQILRNLISNAVKYGPPRGLVRVVVEAPPGGGLEVRVLDEGPGVDPRDVERVFDLLYRSPATAAQAAGSGIGLFVSRRLAEAMGGRVWARARDEGGSEFGLELLPYPGGGPTETDLPATAGAAGT
jgi:PAS domain S-box-containing protein